MTATDNDFEPLPRYHIWLLATAFEGGMAVFAIAVGWLVGYPPWAHLPAVDDAAAWGRGITWGTVASLPMLAGFIFAINVRGGPLRKITAFLEESIVPMLGSCRLIDLAWICGLAGLGEELLFRGLIQDMTVSWFGLPAGIVVTSALFGLVHPFTPTYALIAGLIGGYMSWLRIASGDLVAPIVAHAVYDLVALVYFLRRRARIDAAAS